MAASPAALKAEGNAAYAVGDNETALSSYKRAIALASGGDAEEAAALLHILHSNASAAAARLPGRAQEAQQHADLCVSLQPDWPKGYMRQAAAAQLLHRPGDAERALRAGLKACPAAADQALLRQELRKLLQDDGDQSELRGIFPGSPAQTMREYQSEFGLSMHGPAALAMLPCDAFRWAFLGQLDKFKACFKPEQHLSMRAWPLRLSLPAVIVSGAQRVSYVTDRPTGSGHAAILRLVCEAGARVDARDISGYTALAHATGHHPQLELAKVLLEFGANPSQPTRFGGVPLHSACMAQELESVQLLLDAGADPNSKDLNGISVEDVAKGHPKALALVHQAQGKHQSNAGLVSGGACHNCGKPGATRRCQACLSALYCDRTCQRQAWKQHKKHCPAGSSSGGSEGGAGTTGGQAPRLLRVRPSHDDCYTATLPHSALAQQVASTLGMTEQPVPPLKESFDVRGPGEQAAAAARRDDKLFMVKVQVPLNGAGPMLIYNKSRSYQIYADTTGSDAQQLVKRIQREGWRGCKGYFNARVDAATGELLVQDALLPTQTW